MQDSSARINQCLFLTPQRFESLDLLNSVRRCYLIDRQFVNCDVMRIYVDVTLICCSSTPIYWPSFANYFCMHHVLY